MLNYLLKRLTLVVPTILAVLVLTFFLVRATGSPVDSLLGERGGTPEERARLSHQLGLDRPVAVQFFSYFGRLAKGDLGVVANSEAGEPVAREIARRLPNTIILAVSAMLLATLVGVGSGLVSARLRDSAFDLVLRFLTFCLISTPVFWFGVVLLFVFAYYLGWFPASATGGFSVAAFALPVAALGLRPAAFIARVTRSAALDELSQNYVAAARAKGLSEWTITTRHVLRNIAVPLVTVIGGDLGSLLGGAMITETIFSINGVGRFAVDAVLYRWYDAVMAVTLLWGVIFVLVNLAIDVTYALADPRVAFEEGRA